MSEARRYQQLRAHLCYLKLNDAAEVLPRILDEVRAERLTLTAALERLLELEVTATEQRMLASRMRFACLRSRRSDPDSGTMPGSHLRNGLAGGGGVAGWGTRWRGGVHRGQTTWDIYASLLRQRSRYAA
jgi:hypothetical protein